MARKIRCIFCKKSAILTTYFSGNQLWNLEWKVQKSMKYHIACCLLNVLTGIVGAVTEQFNWTTCCCTHPALTQLRLSSSNVSEIQKCETQLLESGAYCARLKHACC